MVFASQSLEALNGQAVADLKDTLKDPRYFMGASPLIALANAMSGLSYMLHAHIENAAETQLMPDTCDLPTLKRWAKILGMTEKADESLQRLRERVILRLEHPPRGGTESDYQAWVNDCLQDGSRAVFITNSDPGTIRVAFLTNDYRSPLPSDAQIEEVQKYLGERAPIGVTVNTYKLIPVPIRIRIQAKVSDEQKAAGTDALKRVIFDFAHPKKTLSRARLARTIDQALKGAANQLLEPTTDHEFAIGTVGVLDGEVTWTT